MAWNITQTEGKILVKVIKDGETFSKEFEANTTVRVACEEMARQHGLKNFTVTTSDDTEIEEEDGNETLGSFGSTLTLTPRAVGA